jgi:hypothetical protein
MHLALKGCTKSTTRKMTLSSDRLALLCIPLLGLPLDHGFDQVHCLRPIIQRTQIVLALQYIIVTLKSIT